MAHSKLIGAVFTNAKTRHLTSMEWRCQMPTSHFDRSILPPPRVFYEREFGSALGREHRGWRQTKCCFHDGRSKTSLSLNMVEGHFCCFSCGVKGGDVLRF